MTFICDPPPGIELSNTERAQRLDVKGAKTGHEERKGRAQR